MLKLLKGFLSTEITKKKKKYKWIKGPFFFVIDEEHYILIIRVIFIADPIFFVLNDFMSPHKKSLPLRISLVYVTKSAGNCGFGHIYWRNLLWKTPFFVQGLLLTLASRNFLQSNLPISRESAFFSSSILKVTCVTICNYV